MASIMEKLIVLVLISLVVQPALAITGTLAVEGGAVAIALVLLTTIIAIGISLATCIYKNDLCCLGKVNA